MKGLVENMRVPTSLYLVDKIKPTEIAVYSGLKYYANDESKVTVRHKELAKLLNCSISTVVRSIHRLEKFGYLEVDRNMGWSTANDYVILK